MSSPFIIIFIFRSILNNQGLLLRNETKAKAEVFQKFRLFLALDLFASKCKILKYHKVRSLLSNL